MLRSKAHSEEGSGDPMELALLRAGFRAGLKRAALLQHSPLVHKHAFDSASKMMATVHQRGDKYLFAVKGAPEAVLAACGKVIAEDGEVALDAAMRADWHARVEDFGHHGLRVLACAMKTAGQADAPPYQDLTFVGLIGLEDPARADVPHAIQDCREAGIRVVMVTGDHAVTARSIGRAVGLDHAAADVVEGRHVARLTNGKNGELFDVAIFARVSPAEKLTLVRAYQEAGEIVAMTGDGVNDAPALRQADIGVAMGLRGTDVAREAADMVLLDDAFPTIVKAIREGRVIFGNIRRFVAYLLSCNLSEVLVVGLAILSTLPLPIMPLQILYLNLVTDVFPAFALAMGEGEPGILKRPPRDPREPILGRRAMDRHRAAEPGADRRYFRRAGGGAARPRSRRQVGGDRHLPDAGLRAALARLQHAPSAIGPHPQRSHPQSVGLGRAAAVRGAAGGAALSAAGGRGHASGAADAGHVGCRPRHEHRAAHRDRKPPCSRWRRCARGSSHDGDPVALAEIRALRRC